jgi:hypothetical protein
MQCSYIGEIRLNNSAKVAEGRHLCVSSGTNNIQDTTHCPDIRLPVANKARLSTVEIASFRWFDKFTDNSARVKNYGIRS